MYYKKTTRIELLTPDLAKEIATMPGLPGERELKDSRLKYLRTHLEEGNFVGPNWAIAIDSTTGETFRINGQHSSTLLASLEPKDFPEGLNVTIDVFSFSDMLNDAPKLFNLFDNPRSSRTDTEFMGVTRAHYTEFAGMDNGYLVKVASGIDINIRLRMQKVNSEKTEALFTHRDHGFYFSSEIYRKFAVWLHQWDESVDDRGAEEGMVKHFGFISRAGIVSEILSDWIAAPDLATKFWNHVFRENHPDSDHESRELARELNSLFDTKSKKITADEWQRKTRRYWNRYFRFSKSQAKAVEGGSEGTSMPPPVNLGGSPQAHA
jgi:hypothetical protein